MVFSWVDIRVFFFSGLIMSARHQLLSKTGTLGHQRIPIETLKWSSFRLFVVGHREVIECFHEAKKSEKTEKQGCLAMN
jgi:hypothetical protein